MLTISPQLAVHGMDEFKFTGADGKIALLKAERGIDIDKIAKLLDEGLRLDVGKKTVGTSLVIG